MKTTLPSEMISKRLSAPTERKKTNPAPFPKSDKASTKKSTKTTIFDIAREQPVQQSGPLPSQLASSLSAEAALDISSGMSLSEGAHALFEKMATTMLWMYQDGVTETHLLLDAASFKDSVFHESRITIREYRTAPKAFNIELWGNAKAQAAFQLHLPQLAAAFAEAHLPFTVHRLEAFISQEERHLVHRKENAADDEREPS